MITWNANGLLLCKTELLHFLTTESTDIALISETPYSMSVFIDTNFTRVIILVNVTHGGSVILIRNNIAHHSLSSYCTFNLQAICVSLKL